MATIKSESLVLVTRQNGLVVIPAATPLTRLNYFDGKFLRASDLKAEQDYLRQLAAQANQAGGAGVAHGFDLTHGGDDRLDIGPGLAIDPTGRVLLLPQGTSVSVPELIEKSQDLQRLFGKTSEARTADFGACELASAEPSVSSIDSSNLFLIVISPADALCGEEDVYGKLCEEACATSTDRPFAVEGLIVRAVPLRLQTALPSPKVIALTQAHLRSRVASAYFADERRRVASLISKVGLEQETWCLGADAAAGSGVPIGVIARAGSTTVFLDPWIARRERIDAPAKRYWQWRMMMRPWDVFLAQILQFQCQLHDLFRNTPEPGSEVDPCGGARGAISEVTDTISEFKQFYEATARRFTQLNVNLEEGITFKGGLSRLTALNDKLISVNQGLSVLTKDRFLIHGGIIELPSAGYLPVTPGAAATINQQVRRLMGEGVDLRFCVVRPDYVAHALEEAQHMERISLLQGLDDPKDKPEVDVLVPNGEILEQKLLSPGSGFEASVDVNQALISAPVLKQDLGTQPQIQTMNFRGAARAEALASGGGAFYLSCEHRVNLFTQFVAAETLTSAAQPAAATTAEAARPAGASFSESNLSSASGLSSFNVVSAESTFRNPPRLGLWIGLRCDGNIFKLSRGDSTNFNARAILGATSGKSPLFDVEFNGVLQITQAARTTGAAQSVKAHIENAQLSYRGEVFGNAGARTTAFIDLELTATLTAGAAIEILLDHATNDLVLSADWSKQPLEVSAAITQKPGVNLRQTQPISWAHAALKENPNVLEAKHASHIQSLAALEIVAKLLNDANFADAKARLLFPPPPKPTDELLVRGTMDWVLFHRRRTRRCSQEICVPPVAPARHYQVYHLPVGSLQELGAVRKKLIEGKLPEDAFNQLPFVDFAGGLALLLTDPQAWRSDWTNVQPGNSIVYAGIANRDSAAADGDTLALSRLGRLVDAVAPVSTPNAQMQTELLNQIPSSVPASAADGVIFLFTIKAADLNITKTASPAEVLPGNNITYTLTLTNTGPATAQNVTVSDPLPANTTFVSARGLGAEATGWKLNSLTAGQTGTVLFSKASVAEGETASFEIVVRANTATTGALTPIVNTATVASATGDPISGNNTATVTTPLVQPPSADLRLTKTVSPPQFTAGGNLTYTLTLTNNGPTPAQNVIVNDPLPVRTAFVSAQTPAGWTSTLPAAGATTGSVQFRKASVAAGETATFQIVVTPIANAIAPPPPEVSNTASVESSTSDPTPANNSATATSTLIQQTPSADLRIAKTVTPLQFSAGGNLTYAVTLTNLGPTAAQNVVVNDALPSNTTFVSARVVFGAGWTPTLPTGAAPGSVQFRKTSVAVGETATFEIVVRVNSIPGAAPPTVISNTARVDSSTSDPASANNSATATSTLTQQTASADLQITKTANSSSPPVGSNITYTIRLINAGPSEARDVRVIDTLPSKDSFVSARVVSGTGWGAPAVPSGNALGGSVVFSKASVAANESATFEIVIGSGGTGGITNSVRVESVTSDPNPANNVAEVTVESVQPQRTNRAILVFADLDGTRHFPDANFPTTRINFNNDVPEGSTLEDALRAARVAGFVTGVTISSIAPPEPTAAIRLTAVVDVVRRTGGPIVGRPLAQNFGRLTTADAATLQQNRIDLTGVTEVIFIEVEIPG